MMRKILTALLFCLATPSVAQSEQVKAVEGFELDPEYRYAWISGPNTDYLWFLSRTPTVSDDLRAQFIERAGTLGFDTSELIFVDQKNPPR